MDFGDKSQWKNVLKNERVCGRHFESGRPAAAWDRFINDWVRTLNLGKTENRKVNHEAVKRELPDQRRDERYAQKASSMKLLLNAKSQMLVDWPSKISTLERVHLLKKL